MKQIQTLLAIGLFIGSFSAFAQNEGENEEQKLSITSKGLNRMPSMNKN